MRYIIAFQIFEHDFYNASRYFFYATSRLLFIIFQTLPNLSRPGLKRGNLHNALINLGAKWKQFFFFMMANFYKVVNFKRCFCFQVYLNALYDV